MISLGLFPDQTLELRVLGDIVRHQWTHHIHLQLMIASIFQRRPRQRPGDTATTQSLGHLGVPQRNPAHVVQLELEVSGLAVLLEFEPAHRLLFAHFTSAGCSQALGVEREISTSSGVISTETSANSGVLKYRSPVSGSMHRIVDPCGASAHTFNAAANVPPDEMPTKIPSCRARSLLQRIASAFVIRRIWLTPFVSTASLTSLAIKSGLHPCIGCGFHAECAEAGDPSGFRACATPLDSMGASYGSQTTTLFSGPSLASPRATPFSVPPVPNPVTQ